MSPFYIGDDTTCDGVVVWLLPARSTTPLVRNSESAFSPISTEHPLASRGRRGVLLQRRPHRGSLRGRAAGTRAPERAPRRTRPSTHGHGSTRACTSERPTPDDMAACILGSQTTSHGDCAQLEELEVDARVLTGAQVQRFLEAYQVPAPEIAPMLELASELVAVYKTALIRIELGPSSATASATVPASMRHTASPVATSFSA